MKEKFIRVLSPISLAVYAFLDLAVIGFGIFAIKKATIILNTWVIIFIAIEVFAIVIAAIGTKELLSNGVKFSDDEAEFTVVDENNIIAYDEIAAIEAYRDTAASLTKNFDMRHSLLIFTLKDENGNEKTNTIDIGLVNNSTMNKILDEFKNHIDSDKITFTQKKKSDFAAKFENRQKSAESAESIKQEIVKDESDKTKAVSQVPDLDIEPPKRDNK